MAQTSRGIPLADDATVVVPIQTPLNAIANALNTALDEIDDEFGNAQAYFAGTSTDRLALTAPKLRDGISWAETNTGKVYNRRSSVWVESTPIVSLGSVLKNSGTQSGIGTTITELAGISISVTLPSSAKLRFMANVNSYSTSPGDVIVILVRNDTTVIAQFTKQANSSPTIAATSVSNTVIAEVPLAAGTYRFNIAIQRVAGSGTVASAPNTLSPNTLSIDRIGE